MRRVHREVMAPAKRLDVAPAEHRREDQRDAEHRGFEDSPRAQVGHVHPDQHRDRHGRGDGRGRPRTLLHRVDHDQAEHRDQNDHDQQHAAERHQPADRSDLVARHFAQRTAVALERVAEDHEILHASAEHRANHDPQRRGQVAELRGQHRADQRTGAGDSGEVMAEGDPSRRRHVVAPVVEAYGGRRMRVVEFKHAARDEARIETVADGVDTDRGDHEPERARTILAAGECDVSEAARAERSHRYPDKDSCCLQDSPMPAFAVKLRMSEVSGRRRGAPETRACATIG